MGLIDVYEGLKTWASLHTGYSKDALHLVAALAIQFAAAQLFARRLASIGPLVILAGLETVNEAVDFWAFKLGGKDLVAEWAPDTARDLVSTLLVPALLFLVLRYAPHRAVAAASPAESSGAAP